MSLPPDAPLTEDEYVELDEFLCAGDEEDERLPVDAWACKVYASTLRALNSRPINPPRCPYSIP